MLGSQLHVANLLDRRRKIFKAAGHLIFLLIAVTSSSVLAEDIPDLEKLISGAANSDIVWNASSLGILPSLENKKCKAVLLSGKSAIPYLKSALKDDDRIVFAHVLLGFIYERSGTSKTDSWLNLGLKFPAKGGVEYDKNSFKEVRIYWDQVFKEGKN